jgi:hypothetical protein
MALEPEKAKKEAYCMRRQVVVISIGLRFSLSRRENWAWKISSKGMFMALDWVIRMSTRRSWTVRIVPIGPSVAS